MGVISMIENSIKNTETYGANGLNNKDSTDTSIFIFTKS